MHPGLLHAARLQLGSTAGQHVWGSMAWHCPLLAAVCGGRAQRWSQLFRRRGRISQQSRVLQPAPGGGDGGGGCQPQRSGGER